MISQNILCVTVSWWCLLKHKENAFDRIRRTHLYKYLKTIKRESKMKEELQYFLHVYFLTKTNDVIIGSFEIVSSYHIFYFSEIFR